MSAHDAFKKLSHPVASVGALQRGGGRRKRAVLRESSHAERFQTVESR